MSSDLANSVQWMHENKPLVEELLVAEAVIYFRGFSLEDVNVFEQFIYKFPAQNMDYKGGATPRSKTEGKTYESTKRAKCSIYVL